MTYTIILSSEHVMPYKACAVLSSLSSPRPLKAFKGLCRPFKGNIKEYKRICWILYRKKKHA